MPRTHAGAHNGTKIAVAAIAGLVAATLAACSSSSSTNPSTNSSSGSSNASGADGSGAKYPSSFTTLVATSTKPVSSWPGPTTSPLAVHGKTVFSIPCNNLDPACNAIDYGVHQAAAAMGWQANTINGGGTAQSQDAAVKQAIAQHANAIVVDGIDTTTISDGVAAARAAGIAVIAGTGPSTGTPINSKTINYNVILPNKAAGLDLAAYVAVKSNGTAQIAAWTDPEFGVVTERYNAFVDGIKQCSGCKIVKTTQFSQTQISNLGALSQPVLQANPSVKYGWNASDSFVTPMIQAMAQPGARQVGWLSFNLGTENVQYVQDGTEIADAAAPTTWIGWAAVDEANRVLAGKQPVPENLPTELITKDNVSSYLHNTQHGWNGGIDFESKYKQLWTTGKTDKSVTLAQ